MIPQIKHNNIMKRSFHIRSLFFLLLFVFLIATLINNSRTIIRKTLLLRFQLQYPTFEAALLKHAAIDPTEPQWNREIRNLLDQNNLNNNHHHHHQTRRSHVSVTLGSPLLFQRNLVPDFHKALREWFQKRKFEPSIMSELTQLVKNPIEFHHKGNNYSSSSSEKSSSRYSSCAVVGNSGILLKKHYGSVIDSHEVVIRLNHARVQGFEQNVGSKTNISFVNSNILHGCSRMIGCNCHGYNHDVATVMYICQPVHFMDYTLCKRSMGARAPLLVVTDPRFDVLCARIVKYYSLRRFVLESGKGLEEWGPLHDEAMFHYSSGFQAVMLALGVCERVSMFGFGKSVSAKHHYHTNQKSELSLHDYEAEYEFYDDLVHGIRPLPFLKHDTKLPPLVMYH
ncbi:glycosyltransferase 29 [Stylosanthes scabra]|uniref:Glycosyltransferase 29 n=1 Tax=Stylosanthes scabra TaxID=79078 RepID=A0ABU6Y5I8_9FABA|nr:glycosyltransferase 29 [Stylosanthes scabra]